MMREERGVRESLEWECVGNRLLFREKGHGGSKLGLLS